MFFNKSRRTEILLTLLTASQTDSNFHLHCNTELASCSHALGLFDMFSSSFVVSGAFSITAVTSVTVTKKDESGISTP
jgi:hypothetical protein